MIYPSHIPFPHRIWPFYRSYQAGWDAREKLERNVGQLYYVQGQRYERGDVGAMTPDTFEERHSEPKARSKGLPLLR